VTAHGLTSLQFPFVLLHLSPGECQVRKGLHEQSMNLLSSLAGLVSRGTGFSMMIIFYQDEVTDAEGRGGGITTPNLIFSSVLHLLPDNAIVAKHLIL
jgi:hypothetical protein